MQRRFRIWLVLGGVFLLLSLMVVFFFPANREPALRPAWSLSAGPQQTLQVDCYPEGDRCFVLIGSEQNSRARVNAVSAEGEVLGSTDLESELPQNWLNVSGPSLELQFGQTYVLYRSATIMQIVALDQLAQPSWRSEFREDSKAGNPPSEQPADYLLDSIDKVTGIAAGGDAVWQMKLGNEMCHLAQDSVFYIAGEKKIRCFDLFGQQLWQAELPENRAEQVLQAPNGLTYVLGDSSGHEGWDARLYAYDGRGQLMWQSEEPFLIPHAIALAGNELYARTNEEVICIGSDGKVRQRLPCSGTSFELGYAGLGKVFWLQGRAKEATPASRLAAIGIHRQRGPDYDEQLFALDLNTGAVSHGRIDLKQFLSLSFSPNFLIQGRGFAGLMLALREDNTLEAYDTTRLQR